MTLFTEKLSQTQFYKKSNSKKKPVTNPTETTNILEESVTEATNIPEKSITDNLLIEESDAS